MQAEIRNLIYTFDYSKLPGTAGVYVLGRRYGRKFEALYVGKAHTIRWRVRGQPKNLPLMLHLKKAESGKRIIRQCPTASTAVNPADVMRSHRQSPVPTNIGARCFGVL
jgi:hypothetical protein